ncbi:AMP-binding protein [Pseudonocardia sp. KRD-184]|uniref:AMP-binding protein n=1 Tax=Pseudonocardia oceani TaxID=2792013 RepID=A0ABS6UCZ3_9PSEU|nr:AMP-binding protein [Pseudonocardia oceani]MBW0089040.1 AMP-binding protein [Pseudonocardia oceani]MBW0094739.1 AMP-binding protein [Pseudonocardia oceani]MBW0110735.1 AMP-binding protein [Pseudonocardia oceani]MBW0121371.1 AMP-binding protein [Pseudonocardia oceani]MBW0130111.1 AMP-binding protein [Pseudonocardia oceani]
MSEYWNPKTELLPREDLRELQLAKLRLLVGWARARSPHYRRTLAGVRPEQLRTWADLDRIPFLTREEWMRSQDEHPPYGELPVVGPESAIRVHTTSGTSGRTPLRALDSRKDWAWAAEMWCYALWAAGVRSHDVGYVAFGYGSFIGFWGLHNGLERIGALTVPGGAQTTPNRVKQIVDFGATVVASTPTYALRLAAEADALGVDLRNGPVRTVILSGEPVVAETKAIIEDRWGARAHDTAGMTEISTVFMFEPTGRPGGSHIIEDHFIEQVVDPETGREVGYGERGERICTSFGRSTTPLLRYRTADVVVKVPSRGPRTFDLYEGGILGRVDDMKLVRGTNVYPGAIEAVVRGFGGIEEFQVRIERRGDRDEIVLCVEPAPTMGDEPWGRLAADLGRELADAHEGLRFHVERAPADTLPRFELKAKRLTDLRPAPTTRSA